MENKKPAELSDEALVKNEKNLKILISVFIGILLVLFVAAIFVTVKKGFTATVVTPLALTVILMVLIGNWKELKNEIKKRGL